MTLAFVYVTDSSGFELAIHSAMSVSLSQPPPNEVHVFCYRFMPEHAIGLKAAMASVGADLTFHSISNDALERHTTHGRVTTPALFKLPAIRSLADRYDRLAYFDNDILVFEPLDVNAIRFGSKPLAAVLDMDLSYKGVLRQAMVSASNTEAHDFGRYFNSGMMIFDSINLVRKDYLLDYASALDDHKRHCSFKIDCTSVDQCALNMVFDGDWLPLPPGFNTQAGAKFTRPWRTASVRHYCGTRKFLPISLFRNDGRDVRHLKQIREKLSLPTTRFPLLYDVLFALNVLRKYRTDGPMRRFLDTVQALSSTPSRVRRRVSYSSLGNIEFVRYATCVRFLAFSFFMM